MQREHAIDGSRTLLMLAPTTFSYSRFVDGWSGLEVIGLNYADSSWVAIDMTKFFVAPHTSQSLQPLFSVCIRVVAHQSLKLHSEQCRTLHLMILFTYSDIRNLETHNYAYLDLDNREADVP